MKIQTNAGEVRLTAEMVCRGMVFAPKDPSDYCLAEGRIFVVGHRDEANGVWRDARDENLGTNVFGADRLLGCDPTIATRAACERYGVHGDAAAHGFARLRDGGAVDFRREELPNGSAVGFIGGTGRCYSVLRSLTAEERFVGLNLNCANPSDVRRLCCLESREQGSSLFCTLAIGDHDMHEDLATGVKWSAGADFNANLRAAAVIAGPRRCLDCLAGEGQRCGADCPRVVRYKASRCGARPERGQVLDRGNYDLGFHVATGEEACTRDKGCDGCHVAAVDSQNLAWSGPPVFLPCPICTAKVMPYSTGSSMGFSVYDPKAGKNRGSAVCEACYKVHGSNVAALRWEGDMLVPKNDGPLTLEAIGTMAREDGYDATVKRGPAVIRVTVHGATEDYCQRFLRRIEDRTPADCAVFVEAAPARASVTAGCPCDALGRGAPGLHTKDCKAGRALKWEMGTASLGQSQAHILRDGDVYRWQVNHLGLRIRDGVEPHTFDAHAAAGRILFAVHDATAGIEWLAGFFGLLFRIHDSTPAAMRAKQEAPLVALVAAVPEGLDPIGWRAAVLAAREFWATLRGAEREWPQKGDGKDFADWLLLVEHCSPGWYPTPGTAYGAGYDAYHRAIAPAPKVDRVRATWKTRGPVLPCDNGEDE